MNKRQIILRGLLGLGGGGLGVGPALGWGLSDLFRPDPNDPKAVLKHRFRGVGGGELRVDSTFSVNTSVIHNVDLNGLFNTGLGSFEPGGAKISFYGGSVDGDRLPMPRLLRYMLFPEGAEFIGRYNFPYFSGPPLVDITVPVAERIPEETLDALRAMGDGMFRLKLRIHPKTLLVGWDIERRPGFDPKKLDRLGQIAYVYPVFSHIGGDFCEARIRNGIVLVKGWYIDPETKQRVETDF